MTDYSKSQRLSMEWFNYDIESIRKIEIGARSKRHRKSASSDFLHELRRVFFECQRVLKGDRYAVVVFGSSPARQDMIPDFLLDLADIGFALRLTLGETFLRCEGRFRVSLLSALQF